MNIAIESTETSVESAFEASSPTEEIARLVQRLEHGFDVIEQARASGQNVIEWENTWIRMLGRYEAMMDQLAA